MIHGDIKYYRLIAQKKRRLIPARAFSSGVPCPDHAPFPDYLAIWQERNGAGFCVIAGATVANYALRQHMTIAELCAAHSDMGDSLISAIKAQEED